MVTCGRQELLPPHDEHEKHATAVSVRRTRPSERVMLHACEKTAATPSLRRMREACVRRDSVLEEELQLLPRQMLWDQQRLLRG